VTSETELPRLRRELVVARASEQALLTRLESVISELEERENGLAARLTAGLVAAREELVALRRRNDRLEQQLLAAEAVAAEARARLAAEREWVAEQARRVEASQAWRVGHMLVRRARRLTWRSDRGTDALTAIVRRMTDGPAGPSPRA
jgi:hypothetical protein